MSLMDWLFRRSSMATQGTWTPVVLDSDKTDKGQTYIRQDGRWSKTGNTVHFMGAVQLNSTGGLASSSLAFIGGLPFTPSETLGGAVMTKVNYANLESQGTVVARANRGQKEMALARHGSTGGTVGVPISELGNGCTLEFFGTYQA